MKQKRLIRKSSGQFAACLAILLVLATPLFYWLTKSFYAEEIHDVLRAVQSGQPIPETDLEEDIVQGMVIQFGVIAGVLGLAMVLVTGLLSRRLWRPFERTLQTMEQFRIDAPAYEPLPETDVQEFSQLNAALNRLMDSSVAQYRLQKEFTENASHELQTPVAVLQSRLDMLLQSPDLTERQAALVQDMYGVTGRMARLNRDLLLLAKMENRQFDKGEQVDIAAVVRDLLPDWQTLAGDLMLRVEGTEQPIPVTADRTLVETLFNNLVINAIRHNRAGGEIDITLRPTGVSVTNTSDLPALDADKIFERFYQPAMAVPAVPASGKGNGLGLAIAKAVCAYHGWTIRYAYTAGRHCFEVEWG